MKTQERDYDDILRRALRAAAESVEPATDGLDRIRGRVSERHLSPFMLLSQFLDDCFRPILLMLESGGAGALSGLAVLRAHVARGEVYGRRGQALDRARQRSRAAHRSQPPPTGLRTRLGSAFTRLGPAASWLKPVLAVGGAVAIVVAGVFALGQVQQAITPTNQFSHSNTIHHRATVPSSPAAAVPVPSSPSPSYAPASSPGAGVAVSCSPGPNPKASTAPKASVTPTPTISITPPPTPTDSGSPLPTATPTGTYYPLGVNAGELAVVSTPCSSARAPSARASSARASATAS
jgi:hypothetical protein